jgi:hypothetical protein
MSESDLQARAMLATGALPGFSRSPDGALQLVGALDAKLVSWEEWRAADELSIVEPCISSDRVRQIMARPKAERWIQLRGWGAYYSIGEDEISCGRIAKLVPNDAWPTYIEEVIALLDEHECFDAVCFAYGVFGPYADRAEALAAPLPPISKKSNDRRRSDLSRLAFRQLRAGTTPRQLISYLGEANSMLRQPLTTTDIEGVAKWCIAKHVAEVTTRKSGGQRDAA